MELSMQNKRHIYHSNACIDYIENYIYEYKNNDQDSENNIYCLRMPVLVKSDKTIWEPANIYLQSLLIEKSASQSTIESSATNLLDFLRFLEHSNLDVLHLPDEQHERVTYRYRAFLLRSIRQNLIQPSTANGRINRVLRFYDFCILNQLFDKESLRNTPYHTISRRISVPTIYGGSRQIDIESSDLAIRTPQRNISLDALVDGGQLHPLTDEEQCLVKIYLKDVASREFQLMSYIALFTGARIQTVCTLRVSSLLELKKKNINKFDDTYSLNVGSGTPIDTKNGTKMVLKIPTWLLDELISYSKSKRWKIRAKFSYYGENIQNYLFLTSRGDSYYTSLKEIEDRRKTKSLMGFKPKCGLSVRTHVNQMIVKLNSDAVRVNHFSFHDLRATFGLNVIKAMTNSGFNGQDALMYLKERMGHRNILTTMKYLEYSSFTESVVKTSIEFSEALNNYYPNKQVI